MSTTLLGDTIDIHGGGQDLIFPHHENEIAQSEGATGCPFCNYWVHNGYITIDNGKMSKSEGNFFTVRDIAKKYDLNVVRLFILMSQYRSPLDFSEELIRQALAANQRLLNFLDDTEYKLEKSEEKPLSAEDEAFRDRLKRFRDQFDAAMDDDLNTADAIAAIFDLIRESNAYLSAQSPKSLIEEALSLYRELTGVLGIGEKKEEDAVDEVFILKKIEERAQARKAKDFQKADAIRDELLSMGIEIKDSREGTRWNRV